MEPYYPRVEVNLVGEGRVYDRSLVGEVHSLVGRPLWSPVSASTPTCAGTGRHKGVPYDSLGVVWRYWPLTKVLSYTHYTPAMIL